MKPLLMAVAAGLCWGIGEVCTKSVLHGHKVGPLFAIAARSTVALPALWLAFFLARRAGALETAPLLGNLALPEILKLVLGSGLMAGALGMVLFYAALSLDDVSRIKPIAFTVAPATAVVLGCLLLGESMSVRKALAVALLIGGVVLLSTDCPRPRATGTPGGEAHAAGR